MNLEQRQLQMQRSIQKRESREDRRKATYRRNNRTRALKKWGFIANSSAMQYQPDLLDGQDDALVNEWRLFRRVLSWFGPSGYITSRTAFRHPIASALKSTQHKGMPIYLGPPSNRARREAEGETEG